MTVTAPRSGSVLSPDPILHLARRATYGVTPGLLTEMVRRGRDRWLDDQLHPERVKDGAMTPILAKYPKLNSSADELVRLSQRDQRDINDQLTHATLARQFWSRRQLFELMVEFWNNHFTAPAAESTWATKPVEDRTVMRALALGRFEDLLLAVATSPPMLFYLGNYRSEASEPNENYGREILELHTVGLDAGYTEDDVVNSARVLTGRTIDDRYGLFTYDASMHYVGSVRVLGWTSPNASASGGMAVGDSYLRYLAGHRDTAEHLSRKLAIRFVSDDPPQSLIADLADVYQANDTAIVPWLRALFDSPEFAAAAGAKTRRPVEDFGGALRALGITAVPSEVPYVMKRLWEKCGTLGQAPFAVSSPAGYPDTTEYWLSVGGTLGRWNFHHQLSTATAGALTYPPLEQFMAGPTPDTCGEMVDRLCTNLTGQTFRTAHRDALLTAAEMRASAPYDAEAFDYYLIRLVVLILDSPYFTLR